MSIDCLLTTPLIAHRGLFDHHGWMGSAIIPENSLAAIQAAMDKGLGIELDIGMGKDGLPFIFHDDDKN